MITKITILSNGSIAPNKTISLGNQYESVGDIIQFDIPLEYQGYHYYLAFYMKKHDTILLPVNYESGALQFKITTTVTKNSGTYEMVFLATERKVVNGNIDEARKVFVSTTMFGNVKDNFLEDPVVDEEMDDNLQVIYDELLDLRDEILEDLETDYYRGATYIPDVSEDGIISFTRDDGKDISIPTPRNITGPTGPYYKPTLVDGKIVYDKSAVNIPDVEEVDIQGMTKTATEEYLEANLENVANEYLEAHLKEEVDMAVDNKIKFTWNPTTQSFYIEVEELETTPEDSEGVEF